MMRGLFRAGAALLEVLGWALLLIGLAPVIVIVLRVAARRPPALFVCILPVGVPLVIVGAPLLVTGLLLGWLLSLPVLRTEVRPDR